VAVESYWNHAVSVLLNNGNGTFASGIEYQTSADEAITTGDFNRDGKLDLVTPSGVLLNKGDGTFAPWVSYPTGGVGFP